MGIRRCGEGIPGAAWDFKGLQTSHSDGTKHFTSVSLKKMTTLTHQRTKAAGFQVTQRLLLPFVLILETVPSFLNLYPGVTAGSDSGDHNSLSRDKAVGVGRESGEAELLASHCALGAGHPSRRSLSLGLAGKSTANIPAASEAALPASSWPEQPATNILRSFSSACEGESGLLSARQAHTALHHLADSQIWWLRPTTVRPSSTQPLSFCANMILMALTLTGSTQGAGGALLRTSSASQPWCRYGWGSPSWPGAGGPRLVASPDRPVLFCPQGLLLRVCAEPRRALRSVFRLLRVNICLGPTGASLAPAFVFTVSHLCRTWPLPSSGKPRCQGRNASF